MKTRPQPLLSLVDGQNVIIVVGAGGVGKTTTAAALAVSAARRGRRVLCLTIDPAKRLAESLGITEMTAEATRIAPERFEEAGVPVQGELTVAMLDTKRTFDELVVKYASTPERAERLLSNKLYKYVSSSLAGTQEYMAVEKLVAVRDGGAYDLIVLDTPPTANALDFLDAPERLIDALDSAAMRWFVQAFQTTGKLSLNLLARSAAAVLRGIGKITGGGFLEDMAEFLAELNDLFSGFKERANRVRQVLRSEGVAFVLVTSPAPMSIREVLYFAERLRESNMPRSAFIVNRLRLSPHFAEDRPRVDAIGERLASLGLDFGQDGPDRVARAHADAVRLASLDARHVRTLEQATENAVPVVRVPELATDVHDLARLGNLSDVLVAGGV